MAKLLIIIFLGLSCSGCNNTETGEKSKKEKCEERIKSDGGYDPKNPVHRACVAEMAK